MARDLFVLGLSWRTAKVEMRERLAFRDDELPARLQELVGKGAVGEALILSTCNRVEIYGATGRGAPASALTAATAEARRFFAASRGISGEDLSSIVYERTEEEAIRHVFRVASALDSMVVGEAQILGQLKSAYGVAADAGAVGPVLRRCMERAFGVAKRVRTETGIARGAANVSSVAVELAQRVFGDLHGKAVLVVGAGKMSALAARHLRADGAGSLLVTNRSPDKAREVAERVDGTARPWEDLESLIAMADVVISSTGASEPILTRKLLKRAMKARRHKPQVIVDIAVPRDVAPDVAKVDGVYLFDIDDLHRVVAQNLEQRAEEAEDAGALVDDEVVQFARWLESQRVVPTIRALRERFTEVAMAEAEKAARQLESKGSPEQREQVVRRLAGLIVNKLLHQPMNALKEAGGGDGEVDTEALVAACRALFDLPDDYTAEDDDEGRTAAIADGVPADTKNRGHA